MFLYECKARKEVDEMINMWIKIIIAEVLGISIVFNMFYHFLPIYISIPMVIVSSFAGVYGIRDGLNVLKKNVNELEDLK